MADVRICEGRCAIGLAVEEDGALWSGTRCSVDLAAALGATVGDVEDPCAIAQADQAVVEGAVTAPELYERSNA